MRGKADYICDAGGVVKWVIEAKAPGEALDAMVEEQAWSYANHQEIRAVYFVVTNGREFKLYQTNRGSTAGALFECKYEEMASKLNAIENMLSPLAMLRDHPMQRVDTGNQIGPGLRSIVRITSGQIKFSQTSLPIPPLQQMIMTVTDGSVERNDTDRLEARLWSLVPFQSLQKLNEELGLDQMLLTSESTIVSTDSLKPTVFKSERIAILPKGLRLLNLMDWTEVEMPMNVTALVQTRATGYLIDTVFTGGFWGSIFYREFGQGVTLQGAFKLQLS